MGIIFTSPLPCGPPQFHIAVAPCLAIVEVSYKTSPSATQVVGGDILTRMSARLAPSSRPLPLLFIAFLSFFVFPWPSHLRVINVFIVINQYLSTCCPSTRLMCARVRIRGLTKHGMLCPRQSLLLALPLQLPLVINTSSSLSGSVGEMPR